LRILCGTVVYHCDLSLLVKSIMMFSRQTVFQRRSDLEISLVILDNANGAQLRDIKDALRDRLPERPNLHIEYMASDNIGFGRGHNRIFGHATRKQEFDYYLCFNPDGIPERDMLEHLVGFAERDNGRGIYEARQFPVEHPKQYDRKTGQTAWCSGCCLLFPVVLFEKLGGFDDIFFMYMEDVDISWRTKILGYGCYVVPEALFFHFVNENERDMQLLRGYAAVSAYKLGCKYNNARFKRRCLDKLKTFLPNKEISEISRSMEGRKYDFYPSDIDKFTDFDNGFYFSRVRW